jgi:hypothetical protein
MTSGGDSNCLEKTAISMDATESFDWDWNGNFPVSSSSISIPMDQTLDENEGSIDPHDTIDSGAIH